MEPIQSEIDLVGAREKVALFIEGGMRAVNEKSPHPLSEKEFASALKHAIHEACAGRVRITFDPPPPPVDR